jgi:hypothetical protein
MPVLSLTFQVVIGEVAQYVRAAFPAKKFLTMKHDTTWADRELIETIAPYSKAEAVQLHAADVLAYETSLLKLREWYPTGHRIREFMETLLKKPKLGKELNRETYEAIEAPYDSRNRPIRYTMDGYKPERVE